MTIVRLVAALLCLCAAPAASQYVEPTPPKVVHLWPNGAPGSEARKNERELARDYWVRNIHNPSLTIFPADPAKDTGASMVVIPGGGHRLLVWTNEGLNVARALNRMGISVFLLKHRLSGEEGSRYTIADHEMVDVRRAMRWVRAHASEYGIDPARIGVMGFSAGGELASLLSNWSLQVRETPRDAIDRVSARPDFQVLVFPGPVAASFEVAKDSPPAFVVAGSLDECCAASSVAIYERLRKARVPAELHMYAGAGHAFNLDETGRLSVLRWPERMFEWMFDSGLLSVRKGTAK